MAWDRRIEPFNELGELFGGLAVDDAAKLLARWIEIVFNRVVPAAEDRFDLLARVLKAINVDYPSDRETFSRLIRGTMPPSATVIRSPGPRLQIP